MPYKLAFALVLLLSFRCLGQGCSDAGFCTMGAMKPDQPFNKKIEFRLRSMEMSFYRGKTTLTPVVYVATADMNFGITRKTSLQIKLPYQMVQGRLANTQALGDISVCVTHALISKEKFDVNLSVGGKIPTNHADKKSDDGNNLPMYYQTSLGTYDFISGLSLISKHWLFATGIQSPFINQNKNQFLWKNWDNGNPDPEDSAYVHHYKNFDSKNLKRGTDIMLRVERNWRFSRLNFSLGLLPIYRITRDEITNRAGVRVKPDQAQGLAMSVIFTAGYSFNVRSSIKLLLGKKLVQREVNPDGLTRHNVTTLSYVYRF